MAGRHRQRAQHGAALLIFLVLLVMGALTYIINSLTPETVETARAQKTADALAQARDALLGYALSYRDAQAARDLDSNGEDDRMMYGYLPLPDLGSSRNQNLDPLCLDGAGNPLEGCDANFFTGLVFDANGIGPTVVGRFPWRTLGTAPLRDTHGECLWLIVSSLHGRIQRAAPAPVLPPMNWDTLGQLDIVVANGTNALNSALASAHDRPVAIIYAPGPPLAGQDRGPSTTDDVSQCGGNYNAVNYLDPVIAAALGGVTNYLAGTNAASGNTGDSNPANDPDVPKPMLTEGKVFASGGNYLPNACMGANCGLLANDSGLRITEDTLFGTLRKNANFRTDINSMLDRMVNCLRDEIANGASIANGKIAGANNNTCYGEDVHPLGYYPHYREMVFVAAPATVNAAPCAGALLFAGQRAAGQQRITLADKNTAASYLEGTNLSEFTAATNNFVGPDIFDRVTSGGQTASQDIVRCIPVGGSLNEVTSPALNPLGGQIVDYDPGTRTLTLGRIFSITSAQRTANASAFFGCSWTPETHLLGSGLRSYFKFRILDTGEGFTFAIIDGDRNLANVCGAARQHLGYSGNNTVTPSIAYPKIGIEIDTTQTVAQQAAMSPALPNSLENGRDDPSYTGGHFGIAYWGGDSPIATGGACPCAAPRYCSAGACYLPQEEDDNVHGLPATPAASRPSPQNPVASASPTQGTGVYKLDPGLSSIPVNQDIHVRVELTRTATDSTNRSSTYVLEVWLLKQSVTDANQIAAMKNTTRPMAQLYPGFAAHLHDTPTIFDIQGGACTSNADCSPGQTCSSTDNRCYAPALRNARLGFTNSQSTAARDQIISITDLFTTWIP
jgi:hypothetical protein